MEENANSEERCPFGFDKQKHTKKGVHSNSKWWPNQLNLKILHQNSSLISPMDNEFDYTKEFNTLNLSLGSIIFNCYRYTCSFSFKTKLNNKM